jgi:hypothetical protein
MAPSPFKLPFQEVQDAKIYKKRKEVSNFKKRKLINNKKNILIKKYLHTSEIQRNSYSCLRISNKRKKK